jgi:hypothetical protein
MTFTIADVLAWARTKPANEEYDFIHAGVCALGQYARSRGISKDDAACELYRCKFAPEVFYLLRCAANGTYRDGGCTFGGFVKRLEKILPASPVSDTWTKAAAYGAVDQLVREFGA